MSSLSALVAVIAGAVLYQKFGGKRDKVMVIILAATSIVCMLSTVAGFYIFSAAMGAAEAGLEISALNAFQLYMQDADFSRAFYADLLMMLLFSIRQERREAFIPLRFHLASKTLAGMSMSRFLTGQSPNRSVIFISCSLYLLFRFLS